MSFGLRLAANAEDTREFVLSSSEVITRFMAKYTEYERSFRGSEAGKQFDHLLTNVYKALLLYMIALEKYLRQSGPGSSSRLIGNVGFDNANFILFQRASCTCD